VTAIFPVILCGGAGTRLWPASRPDRPKQFLKLLGAYSSFQETLLRVRDLAQEREIIVVTGAAMVEMVREQAREIDASITVLIEPQARNSAPRRGRRRRPGRAPGSRRGDADAGRRPPCRRTRGVPRGRARGGRRGRRRA
jgi:hypothetical protein